MDTTVVAPHRPEEDTMNQEQTISNIVDYLQNPRNRGLLESLITEARLPYQSKAIENMEDEELEAICSDVFSKDCIAR